jgi:hypothetical protein
MAEKKQNVKVEKGSETSLKVDPKITLNLPMK